MRVSFCRHELIQDGLHRVMHVVSWLGCWRYNDLRAISYSSCNPEINKEFRVSEIKNANC